MSRYEWVGCGKLKNYTTTTVCYSQITAIKLLIIKHIQNKKIRTLLAGYKSLCH